MCNNRLTPYVIGFVIADDTGLREHANAGNLDETRILSAWGANSWTYNGQYPIPPYLLISPSPTHSGPLFVEGTGVAEPGGLLGTYFSDPAFTNPIYQLKESPNRDWGLYPPDNGRLPPDGLSLPSNNFSVIWSGTFRIPTSGVVEGWLGVAVSSNCSTKLFVDGRLLVESKTSLNGNILGNIPGRTFSLTNGEAAPPGAAAFTFREGASHAIRIEFQAFNSAQKFENVNSVNSHVELFWNLVDREDPVAKAVSIAQQADIIVLAVGAAWNSDGENGDRATLGLSPNQARLADAIFGLGKRVILVLSGGRPFAVPDYYLKSNAALHAFFLGQSGGRAIADVLVGKTNPGGRLPISIPVHVGQLPVYYSYKPTAHLATYVDAPSLPQSCLSQTFSIHSDTAYRTQISRAKPFGRNLRAASPLVVPSYLLRTSRMTAL
ncbi:hypothetical protein HGRIS_000534 [Hohenbuehelia grisea]|uniref:PA14 domain-containing protein n=1 Tax=Hohenbuehelia grisea TaxID=104357 RepID=A0ABR3JT98_9AGAR